MGKIQQNYNVGIVKCAHDTECRYGKTTFVHFFCFQHCNALLTFWVNISQQFKKITQTLQQQQHN